MSEDEEGNPPLSLDLEDSREDWRNFKTPSPLHPRRAPVRGSSTPVVPMSLSFTEGEPHTTGLTIPTPEPSGSSSSVQEVVRRKSSRVTTPKKCTSSTCYGTCNSGCSNSPKKTVMNKRKSGSDTAGGSQSKRSSLQHLHKIEELFLLLLEVKHLKQKINRLHDFCTTFVQTVQRLCFYFLFV